MKSKILLLIVLTAYSYSVNAQTQKGKNVFGITGLYASNEENSLTSGSKTTEMKIGINYGRFIYKNLEIGVNASYNWQRSFTQSDYLIDFGSSYTLGKALTETDLTYGTVGIYLKHYIDLSEKFKLYNELFASFGLGKQQNEYIAISRKLNSGRYTSYSAGLNTGLAYFPTKKISINLGINVVNFDKTEANYKNSPNERSENFTFGLKSLKPMLGINFHF